MKLKAVLFAVSFVVAAQAAHADVVKCTSTHLGQPDDLVAYIQRDSGKSIGSKNIVLARSQSAKSEALIVAHFRGDQGETGFDADNGIQLLVAGAPEQREDRDGASPNRVFLGKTMSELQDLHIYWRPSMQSEKSFTTQIRADMKALQSSAEPRANTLSCSVIRAQNFASPEELHTFAESDLSIK